MAKIDEQLEWYNKGRQKAVEIAKAAVRDGNDPIAALEEEIRFSERLKTPPQLTKKQYQKEFRKIQSFTIESMILSALIALWENEQWDAEKLNEFAETMNRYATAVVEGSISWDDIIDTLRQYGVEVNIE